MRQLLINAEAGCGGEVEEMARRHQATNIARLKSDDQGDLVLIHLRNRQLAQVFDALEDLPVEWTTLMPQDVYPMSPPASEVADRIVDLAPRSPLEIWLNGLQSMGGWKGFLGYAVLGAIIVWVGMFTNTIYLLVAAMLIAPFAGPAMNTAIATAGGHRRMLGHNLLRYLAALAVVVAVTWVLTLLLNVQTVTNIMVDVSEVSAASVFLPLAAGAAGALTLVQNEKSSLVPGTAAGLLIAASLAPPAGLIGMALALDRLDMVYNAVFILALQLVAINLAGSLIFRWYGLDSSGIRYERGTSTIYYLSIGLSVVGLAALLLLQFSDTPQLQRSTRAQRAVSVADEVLAGTDVASLVEANFRFTRPAAAENDPPTLLGVVYVQKLPNSSLTNQEIERFLTTAIQRALLAEGYNVEPLINVTVLEPSP